MHGHRKLIRHYHDPGELHELTFSCYQRLPLLTNDHWRILLSQSIDRAIRNQSFRLVAFVLMPEHVHLLVLPDAKKVEIGDLLSAIKRPHSSRIKKILQAANDPLLEKLTIRERPGKMVFRYWQEGPGYDRNLSTQSAVLSAIDYIHLNPVRRGLVRNACDWRWSSARWYISDRNLIDSDLPEIHGLPWDFFEFGKV